MDVRGIIDRTPDSSREFFRRLSVPERLGAQGFPTSLAMDLSPASALKAAGNAYPVPCESTRAAEKAWSKKIAAADEADIDYAGPNGELRCRVEI